MRSVIPAATRLAAPVLARVRAETPSIGRGALHFNHAGASPSPEPVVERVVAHLRRETEIGGYAAAEEVKAELAGVYDAIAELIGAASDEVALVEHASIAWMKAFSCVPLREGDIVLVAGKAEYAAQLVEILRECKERKCILQVAPTDSYGQVDVDGLARCIDEAGFGPDGRSKIRLVALTHVPTNGGLVNPAEAVGRVCRERGVLYLLDACQSVGQLALDVNRLGCDFLSATGRKFLRAPRGTGFLYARRATLPQLKDPAFLDHWAAPLARDGRSYELSSGSRRFEFWEGATANRLGLGVAVRYVLSLGDSNIEACVADLARSLRARLCEADIEGLEVMDLGQKRCGIVTFHLGRGGPAAADVKAALLRKNIYVSVSPPASTAFDGLARDLPELVRASVHYVNTEEEVDKFVAALKVCVESWRSVAAHGKL